MSAYKIQTLGNYPEESIQHSERIKSLKSRITHFTTTKKIAATSLLVKWDTGLLFGTGCLQKMR